MRIGIVGNGSDKFTDQGRQAAFEVIRSLLRPWDTLLSGHSPVGGIDIWAEEVAQELGVEMNIKTPEVHQWNPPGGYGYKARNLDIALLSDEVHVILANAYPDEYTGRRFDVCYHCARAKNPVDWHVKSGGCWTGLQALKVDVPAHWHVVNN